MNTLRIIFAAPVGGTTALLVLVILCYFNWTITRALWGIAKRHFMYVTRDRKKQEFHALCTGIALATIIIFFMKGKRNGK